MKFRIAAAALIGAACFAPFAAQAQQAPAHNSSGSYPHIAIVRVYVTDFARSERFYRDVFGLSEPRAVGDHERVFTLPEGPRLVLELTEAPRGNGGFALVVADIDAVMSRTPAAGGAILEPARDLRSMPMRIAFVTDPDGATIEVLQSIR